MSKSTRINPNHIVHYIVDFLVNRIRFGYVRNSGGLYGRHVEICLRHVKWFHLNDLWFCHWTWKRILMDHHVCDGVTMSVSSKSLTNRIPAVESGSTRPGTNVSQDRRQMKYVETPCDILSARIRNFRLHYCGKFAIFDWEVCEIWAHGTPNHASQMNNNLPFS